MRYYGNIREVKGTTQRGLAWICGYVASNCYSVREAYKNPSIYKTRGERAILDDMAEVNKNRKTRAHGYKVIGYNSCTFTAGYLYDIITERTNCDGLPIMQRWLIIETAYKTYKIFLKVL